MTDDIETLRRLAQHEERLGRVAESRGMAEYADDCFRAAKFHRWKIQQLEQAKRIRLTPMTLKLR